MARNRRTSNARFSKDDRVEQSLRHSIKDGVFFSMMTGGAESYFSAFAIFLHATTLQVGTLASLPPLLASFTQLLSAWAGRRIGRRKPLILIGAWAQAALLVPLGIVPLMFPEHAMVALIVLVFVYLCGPNLGAPQWSSLVGDLLAENRRGRFFALRTRLSTVASLAALIVAGLLLQAFDTAGRTYLGFITVFTLAAVARCVSAYHLGRMYDPPGQVAALKFPANVSFWRRIRHSNLARFSFFFACMQFSVAISGPYFTLYLLRDLNLTYAEFMVSTVASVAIQFLTLNRWGRLSDLFGNRVILLTTGCLIPLLPTLWLLSTSYLWVLSVQALGGLLWAGFTLSATNFIFDLTTPDRRATLIASHNVLAATAVFLGATVGGLLATSLPTEITVGSKTFAWQTPLYGVFVISTLARITTAAAFLPWLREVRRVRPMSMSGLMFRVTRMHPISGLIFEIVGRKEDEDETEDGKGTAKTEAEEEDGKEQ